MLTWRAMTEIQHSSQWFAADTDWTSIDCEGVLPFERRGHHLGFAKPREARTPEPAEILARWAVDRPIHLPGALASTLAGVRAAIARTLESFEALRSEEVEFLDEVWARVGEEGVFEPAGASVDLGDEREIEKVFAHFGPEESRIARDLYAKLSWISADESDISMRVRFSFGSESLSEWLEDPARAPYSDSFADAVFPECAAVTGNAELMAMVSGLVGSEIRLSERIMYNNAPGGGAFFHNDHETLQLGVLFAQLEGETLWLALPKRELVSELLASAEGELAQQLTSPEVTLAALSEEDQPDLESFLNESPEFTRRLVERGSCFHVRAGDVLLMPSHGTDDVCWHSVFSLGEHPSLALSSGVFALTPPA